MTSYYNTNEETGDTLDQSVIQSKYQESVILALFNDVQVGMTPCEVHSILTNGWPITSIRRAMTNLTSRGELLKTRTMRKGIYGKMVHVWAIPPSHVPEMDLLNQQMPLI